LATRRRARIRQRRVDGRVPSHVTAPATRSLGDKSLFRVARSDAPMRPSTIDPSDVSTNAGNRYDVVGGGVLYLAGEAAGCYADALARDNPLQAEHGRCAPEEYGSWCVFWYGYGYHSRYENTRLTDHVPKARSLPQPPLALVAAEIRFTDAPRLRQQSTLDAIAVALEDILPVQAQHEQAINVQMVAGQPPQVQVAAGRLMKDVASTAAMTLFPDRLTFETTAYAEFEAFRSAVLACTTALVEAHVTPAIQRVGLRYLDEIRVPSATVADARDWREWIDTRLVDHLLIGPTDAPITRAEGLISYDLSERQGLNFRFAALPNGAVVLSANLVRQPFEQDLPLFVLDFDGYEEFTAPTATLLDAGVVARTLDAVHGPSGATFQNAITDAAREIFRVRNL